METGGCPHAAIREDISANLHACEKLTAAIDDLQIILLESGGDNLAASYSPELADYTIYVIDVAGGDKVPRKVSTCAKMGTRAPESRALTPSTQPIDQYKITIKINLRTSSFTQGGPGVTQSDLLVINKTDLAPAVGASLDVMSRDAKKMRGDGPTIFAQCRENLGEGVDEIFNLVLNAWMEK